VQVKSSSMREGSKRNRFVWKKWETAVDNKQYEELRDIKVVASVKVKWMDRSRLLEKAIDSDGGKEKYNWKKLETGSENNITKKNLLGGEKTTKRDTTKQVRDWPGGSPQKPKEEEVTGR